jgi:hypothetical protein
MVCPTLKLIVSSAILLGSGGCALLPKGSDPGAFCVLYTQVINEAADAEIRGTPRFKRNTLINEKLYRTTCPKPPVP